MFEVTKETFAEREKRILEFWKEQAIFKKSLTNREEHPHFAFYDGPPFATGLPHYGHILAGTIKDVVARYKTMKGFYVPRRFGWDCHGLPVENEIEKLHKLSGANAIEEFGIDKFNEECRKIVLRYTKEWEKTVTRMGRWVEFDRTYRTMDLSFMESVWWVFSNIWDKDLVYEGFKVMPVSPLLGTPLSNFEANLNYRDVDDPSLTVKFAIENQDNTFFLVWTTTPWTLVSNLALAVGEKIEYVKVKDKENSEIYILAKDRVSSYYKYDSEYEILEIVKGIDLIAHNYVPILPYFSSHQSAFRVLKAPFVTTEDGTGIVHMAPAFGEDDFYVCKENNIEPVCPVDVNCKFLPEIQEYAGLFVKDADKGIIKRLKQEDKVVSHSTKRHRYPFCWRTDSPLIYKAVSTWFVSVEKIKDKIINNNQEIQWVPGYIKDGRFGKWLENARDWAISRNRYWGTPIPIWRSEDGDSIVIKSIAELEEKTQSKVTDLHRHFIDHLKFKYDGKEYTRISEVFDCWFESGSMPYAQNHYPFENVEATEKDFPADFIAEGLDQTRGWFYTLNVISTALFDKPATKNVIVNGIVLAEDGHKMSKRLKNYPEPEAVMDRFGSDAIRLYLLHSPVVRAEDFSFSEKGVEGVLRQFLIPLWNSYVFLSTYAKINNWKPEKKRYTKPVADIDCWILSLLQKLVKDVEVGMDHYRLDKAVEPFIEFIDSLTNWYIRRSRSRFWEDEECQDRREAFETLYRVLMVLVKIAAPYIPFLADEIFTQLRGELDPISVHLSDYPMFDQSLSDATLEFDMQQVRRVVNTGHSLRKEHHLKVRQPLAHAHIVTADSKIIEALKRHSDLIMEELNVKQLTFNLDEEKFVTLMPKPNFRVLGSKVGKLMKKVKVAIENLEQKDLQSLYNQEVIDVALDGEIISLTEEDVLIERQVIEGLVAACAGPITIALDTNITEELTREAYAREIISKINSMRRNGGFDVVDRIQVTIDTTPPVIAAYEIYKTLIDKEILASSVRFTTLVNEEKFPLNGEMTKISICKVKG